MYSFRFTVTYLANRLASRLVFLSCWYAYVFSKHIERCTVTHGAPRAPTGGDPEVRNPIVLRRLGCLADVPTGEWAGGPFQRLRRRLFSSQRKFSTANVAKGCASMKARTAPSSVMIGKVTFTLELQDLGRSGVS